MSVMMLESDHLSVIAEAAVRLGWVPAELKQQCFDALNQANVEAWEQRYGVKWTAQCALHDLSDRKIDWRKVPKLIRSYRYQVCEWSGFMLSYVNLLTEVVHDYLQRHYPLPSGLEDTSPWTIFDISELDTDEDIVLQFEF